MRMLCEELALELGFNVSKEIRLYAIWNESMVHERICNVRRCHFRCRTARATSEQLSMTSKMYLLS